MKTHEREDLMQVLVFMPRELAEALAVRAEEIGLSKSELLRRLAAAFTGYELEAGVTE